MANFTPRKILDNVLFNASHIDKATLDENLAKLPFVAELKSKLLVFEDVPYHVDFAQLVSNVREIDRIITAGHDVTGRDVVSLPSVIVRAPKEDLNGNKIVSPPHSLYASELIWPSFDWPTEKVMSGIVLLIGDTGAGKTYSMVNNYEVDIYVRYSEPQEQADMGSNVVPARSLFEAISIAMALSILGARVAVDSLRSLVYTLKGNAVTGGMSGSMYDVTTQMNNMFADLGTAVMLALNPLSPTKKDREGELDTAATDDLVRKLASGVAGAVHIHNGGEIKSETYRLTDGRYASVRHGSGSGGKVPTQAKNQNAASIAASQKAATLRGSFTTLSMIALKENSSHDLMANAMGPVPPEGDDSPRTPAPFIL